MASHHSHTMTLRITLWVIAFLLPAVSFGIVLPHSLYVLIPVLAAVDGLTGRGSFRRFVVWLGLIFLYEMVYQLPLGVLVIPVMLMGVVHVPLSRLVRLETRMSSEHTGAAFVVQALTVASLWVVGMVITSTFVGSLYDASHVFSWDALVVVWWHGRVALYAFGMVSVTVLLLSGARFGRRRVDVLGYGNLQTEQNISR